jgi:hypothetical protein
VALPLTATAQEAEKPEPVVVEEDLGDGFRWVSVNGGPGAIIDDETGLIMKQIYGRVGIVDQESGAILTLGDDGEPQVKFYGGGKKDHGAQGELPPEKLERMRAFMERVRAHPSYRDRGEIPRGGEDGKPRRTRQLPGIDWDARVARLLGLLEVADEEAEALRPLVLAVLRQQDAIRRSTLVPHQLQPESADATKRAPDRSDRGRGELPAAIRTFLDTLRRNGPLDEAQVEQDLAAYRTARAEQDAELKRLRDELRGVLTPLQEAKLVAVGVLD